MALRNLPALPTLAPIHSGLFYDQGGGSGVFSPPVSSGDPYGGFGGGFGSSGGGLNTGSDIYGNPAIGIIDVGGMAGNAATTAGKAATTAALGLFDWGRIAAFLLGLILIAGGIYLTKPMQQTMKVVVGHAKRAAGAIAESVAE